MRTAVEKADAVVKERRRVLFPDGRGLLDKLACLVGPSREYVSSTGKTENAPRALRFFQEAHHISTKLQSVNLKRYDMMYTADCMKHMSLTQEACRMQNRRLFKMFIQGISSVIVIFLRYILCSLFIKPSSM